MKMFCDGRVIDARDFGAQFEREDHDQPALVAAVAHLRANGGGFLYIPPPPQGEEKP